MSDSSDLEAAAKLNQILEEVDKVKKAGLYNTTVDGRPIITGGESDRDSGIYRHSLDGKAKNFDQKIYMFPESYNQLRKELHDYWPALWAVVQWSLAHRAEEFVEIMNEALGLAVVFDTEKVDFISTTFLNRLIEMRKSGGFTLLASNDPTEVKAIFDKFRPKGEQS